MTNRANRGLELLRGMSSISEHQFFDLKHDKKYSVDSRAYKFLKRAFDADISESQINNKSKYRSAQALIANWNLSTDIDSRGAALGTCVLGSEWLSEQKGEIAPDPLD